MTSPVLTIRAGDALMDLQDIMKWNHVRHVPVVAASGEVIGIVSQRDLLAAAHSTIATGTSPADRRQHLAMSDVERVMQRNVVTIDPREPVQVAAAQMRSRRIGCLPVMDGGQLVGIITDADLVRLVEHLSDALLAEVQRPLPRSSAV